MEYLGYVAPFYVSRHRLRILSNRAEKGRFNLSGKIMIPSVGELQIDRETVDPATGALLETAVNWLIQNGAIGDIAQGDYEYCWVWMNSRMTRVQNAEAGVDHIIVAGENAHSPNNWKCVLAGSRVNLTSLLETSSVPFLGSSPLAIQTVIQILSKDAVPTTGTCNQLLVACQAVVEEPAVIEWNIAGVVEVLKQCKKEKLMLGAPLFLTYYSNF